jgi:hypothetical protein
MCFPFDPLQPPTPKARDLVSSLRCLMLFQLVFAITKLFVGDFSTSILDFLAIFILWQGYVTLSFCSMVMYITCVGLCLVMILVVLGASIQNHTSVVPDGNIFWGVVEYSCCVFYMVAIYFSFQAYREFKACTYEDTTGRLRDGGFGFFGMWDMDNNDPSGKRAIQILIK